jgi:hypothetical protein
MSEVYKATIAAREERKVAKAIGCVKVKKNEIEKPPLIKLKSASINNLLPTSSKGTDSTSFPESVNKLPALPPSPKCVCDHPISSESNNQIVAPKSIDDVSLPISPSPSSVENKRTSPVPQSIQPQGENSQEFWLLLLFYL